jgi:hypothetical protein
LSTLTALTISFPLFSMSYLLLVGTRTLTLTGGLVSGQ